MSRQNEIDKYILNHIEPEDEVLTELDRDTHLNVIGARMISGHLQGQVLTMLSKMISPRCTAEQSKKTVAGPNCHFNRKSR